MPNLYSVTEGNTKSVLVESKIAVEFYATRPDVIEYKRHLKRIDDYKNAAKEIIKPCLAIRSNSIIFKTNFEMPQHLIRIQTDSKAAEFEYCGLVGKAQYIAPSDGSMRVYLNPKV
tara:strand:- start:246 stop:593 length:348 start_codon:yes stop_codon:yes gene_type:complete